MWHVPKVEKGERLEVSFDIKGSGEVDAEALNRFHGVHFGDEIESDDLPAVEEEVPAEAEADAEAESAEEAEEAADTEPADEAEEAADEGPKMKFREDMLLRVMEAAGIDGGHRDAFVAFAADYDHDDNGYLKKAELEDAAKAWNEANGEAGEESTEEAAEESAEEAPAEDAPAEEAEAVEEKACPICGTMNAADNDKCMACDYDFTQ